MGVFRENIAVLFTGPINGAYYQSYAKYIVKFFEEYSKNGVLFWGVTTQNEPSSGLIPFYK